jgi:hypothetical protein
MISLDGLREGLEPLAGPGCEPFLLTHRRRHGHVDGDVRVVGVVEDPGQVALQREGVEGPGGLVAVLHGHARVGRGRNHEIDDMVQPFGDDVIRPSGDGQKIFEAGVDGLGHGLEVPGVKR